MDDTSQEHPVALSGFQSPKSRSTFAVACLAAIMVLDLASIWSALLQIDLLERATTGLVTVTEAEANDRREQSIAILYVIVFITSVIAFLRWFHLVYKNLGTLLTADETLSVTPGWAVGYYFIPIINLYRPYQTMQEAWRRCAGNEGAIVVLWWLTFLASGVVSRVSARYALDAGHSIDALMTMTRWQIAESLVSIPAAILAIVMVRRLTTHQIERADDHLLAVFA